MHLQRQADRRQAVCAKWSFLMYSLSPTPKCRIHKYKSGVASMENRISLHFLTFLHQKWEKRFKKTLLTMLCTGPCTVRNGNLWQKKPFLPDFYQLRTHTYLRKSIKNQVILQFCVTPTPPTPPPPLPTSLKVPSLSLLFLLSKLPKSLNNVYCRRVSLTQKTTRGPFRLPCASSHSTTWYEKLITSKSVLGVEVVCSLGMLNWKWALLVVQTSPNVLLSSSFLSPTLKVKAAVPFSSLSLSFFPSLKTFQRPFQALPWEYTV